MYLNKILLTTDFSDNSTVAFELARHEAQLTKSEITLLYVLEPTVLPLALDVYSPPSDFIARMESEHLEIAKGKLNELVSKYFGDTKITPLVLKTLDNVANTVCQYAKQNNFGLITIANQGKGALKRLFLGSTTERIVRLATNPILMAHGAIKSSKRDSDYTENYKTIVVTTDFSDDAERAFKYAAYEAKLNNAKVILAHVVQEAFAPELFERSAGDDIINDFDVQKIQNNYLQGLSEKLEKYAKDHFPLAAIETKLLEKTFPIADAISEFCRKIDCDLVVMATHGMNRTIQLVGGVAERVMRDAPCPLLLIPKNNK